VQVVLKTDDNALSK